MEESLMHKTVNKCNHFQLTKIIYPSLSPVHSPFGVALRGIYPMPPPPPTTYYAITFDQKLKCYTYDSNILLLRTDSIAQSNCVVQSILLHYSPDAINTLLFQTFNIWVAISSSPLAFVLNLNLFISFS